jgi:hypothetical protein
MCKNHTEINVEVIVRKDSQGEWFSFLKAALRFPIQ